MSDDSRYTLKYINKLHTFLRCDLLHNVRRLTSTVRLHLMHTTQEYSTENNQNAVIRVYAYKKTFIHGSEGNTLHYLAGNTQTTNHSSDKRTLTLLTDAPPPP
jgi:hypothetical protein